MARTPKPRDDALLSDPFAERQVVAQSAPMDLLGARFVFESSSPRLLRLVDEAFGRLPPHRFGAQVPRLSLSLLLGAAAPSRSSWGGPPALGMQSGSGYLLAAPPSSSFVCLSPDAHTGVVSVARSLLRFPYHARYELIEFAVFTLASRCQGLASLHAACVARNGRAVLLMGGSGAGKSTVTLQCLLHGFDLVAEDSVFVHPGTLRATGLANFLHVTADSLRWVGRARDVAAIRSSPIIRRRSGVRKFELDLRRKRYRLAASPPTLAALVFLSPEPARGRSLLTPLSTAARRSALAAEQTYAAGQPGWTSFVRDLQRLDAFVLRRGPHPRDSVEALEALLARSGVGSR